MGFSSKKLILDFQNYLQGLKYSFFTIKSYCSDLSLYLNYLDKNIHLKEKFFSKNSIRYFLLKRITKGVSHRSNARFISCIKKLRDFLEEKDNNFQSEIDHLNLPKFNKIRPSVLQKNEIDLIVNQTLKNWQEARDIAIFYVLYTCGVRINESLNLKYKDILKSGGKRFLKILGKGNVQREVPLLEITFEKIQDYIHLCDFNPLDKDHFLFLGKKGKKLNPSVFQRKFQSWKKIYSFNSNVTVHSIRHTFACELIRAKVDVRSVQEILGHSSILTTQLYVSMTDQKLQSEYEVLCEYL